MMLDNDDDDGTDADAIGRAAGAVGGVQSAHWNGDDRPRPGRTSNQ